MARRAEPLSPSKPLPLPERVAAFQRGLSAESRAALILIAKAYRILERRWKTPFGEIDIVARRRGVVVFVEVKARGSIDEAVEAVTERTKRRVIGAAELWLARHPRYANGGIRFDVIVVTPGKMPRRIVNAFTAEVA
ncbi:MAG TPA: YraN family protein [Xanthobacteraceae bacterium]